MDKDFFQNILNLNLHEDKIKIIQNLFNDVVSNDFSRGSDIFENPIPKSQNHTNTISNSVQSQEATQSMLERLNSKEDGSKN